MSTENKKTLQYINEYYDNQKSAFTFNDLNKMIMEQMFNLEAVIEASEPAEVVEEEYDAQFYEDREQLFQEFEKSILEEINQQTLQEAAKGKTSSKGKGKTKGKQVETVTLSLFTGAPTEAWGDPKSATFKRIKPFINKATGGGKKDFKSKLNALFSLIDATPKSQGGESGITSQGRIIASLVLIEALAAILNQFGESPGGFVFEGFLAAITLGRQVSDKDERGTLPIEDIIAFEEKGPWGRPASLKLLKGRTFKPGKKEGSAIVDRGGTQIKGSWQNLVTFFDRREELDYIVAFKAGKGDRSLSIVKFTINRENIVDLMLNTGNQELFGSSRNAQKARRLSRSGNWKELRKLLWQTFGGEPPEEEETQYYKDINDISLKDAEEIVSLSPDSDKAKAIRRSHVRYVTKHKENLAENKNWNIDLFEQINKMHILNEKEGETQFKMGQQFFATTGKSYGDEPDPDAPASVLPGWEVLVADVDLSDKNLRKVNEKWTKVLQGNVRLLLHSFESLTKNINTFFTSADRKMGQSKGTEAAGNSKNIETNMKNAVKEEQSSKIKP